MTASAAAGFLECTQDPSDKLDYVVDFEAALARYRRPATTYSSTTKVRSRLAPGLQFSASAGQSGAREPRWPTSIAGTVVDGGVTWTAEAVATTSLETTLASAAWAADTGITVSGQAESGQKSTVYVSGGTDGQDYLLTCVGTMADGRKMTAVFVIQIRHRTAA